MNFENLGLIKPLLKAVEETGYSTPTPIQSATIETVLDGADLMASAQTGTGKTAAFTLPMLQKLNSGRRGNHPRALIVTPTRELAAQILDSIETYGKHLSLRSIAVFGGVKINPQIAKLRRGIDILVATPGRLLDLHNQNAVSLDDIELLILDEADRMLDMGFIHDIRKIHRLLPEKKQSLMFSATFSDDIRGLARSMLNRPVEVDVAAKNTTAETVEHKLHPVDKARKADLLAHLFHDQGWYQALVFTRTKHGANKLVKQLAKANIKAVAIHGNKSQAHRTRALEDFKNHRVTMLVATDIASRGLDIEQLPIVINHDLPNVPEDYVHRIGRTGRAAATGKAISLVSADEIKPLRDIERVIRQPIQREMVDGFEPDHSLPESQARSRQRPEGQKSRGRSRRRRGNARKAA